MRGPGSDLDLNALYKSDLNRSMPNVPNTLLSVPNQYGNVNMSLSASNPNMMAPLRTAPAPPTPAFLPVGQPNGLAQMQPNAFIQMPPQMVQNGLQMVQNGPQIIQNGPQMVQNGPQMVQNGPQMVQNGPQMVQNGVQMVPNVPNGMQMVMSNMSTNGMPMGMQNNFVPEITISEAPRQELNAMTVDNTFLAANQPDSNILASNPFQDQKASLRKTDSLVSCTEPGPVNATDNDLTRSPTTDEFMAILERNSTVLKEATEKNQELKEVLDAKKDEPDSKDDVEFSDIVDAKEVTEDINAKDTEKSKFFLGFLVLSLPFLLVCSLDWLSKIYSLYIVFQNHPKCLI